MSAPSSPPKTFTLAGADSSFGSRTKDVFGSLGTIEAKHAAFATTRAGRDLDLIKPDPIDEDLGRVTGGPIHVGKGEQVVDGEFKVPFKAASHRRVGGESSGGRAPFLNPEKWKRYDLSEVTPGQMSERSNQTAALDFLHAARHASESGQEAEPVEQELIGTSGETSRHVFHRPGGAEKPGTVGKPGSVGKPRSVEKLGTARKPGTVGNLGSAGKSDEKQVAFIPKFPPATSVAAVWNEEEESGFEISISSDTPGTNLAKNSSELTVNSVPLTLESKSITGSAMNSHLSAPKGGVTFKAVSVARHVRKRDDDNEQQEEEEELVELRRPKLLKSSDKIAVSSVAATGKGERGVEGKEEDFKDVDVNDVDDREEAEVEDMIEGDGESHLL